MVSLIQLIDFVFLPAAEPEDLQVQPGVGLPDGRWSGAILPESHAVVPWAFASSFGGL